VTDLPDLKIKALVAFPAEVHGGTGIGVEKDANIFTFNIDYTEIGEVASVSDLTTTFVVLHDATSDTYLRISLTNLKTVLGIV
jgi:hypothetical protein